MSQITHDLALVARVSRTSLPTLETTLASVVPQPAPDDALKLSRIFVGRVARIAATATVASIALLLFLWVQIPYLPRSRVYHYVTEKLQPIGDVDKGDAILILLFVGAAVYAVAAHVAARRFAARPRRERVDALVRSSVAIPTAAVLFFVTFFGLAYVALGGNQIYDLIQSGYFPAANGLRHGVSVLMVVAFAVGCFAAWRFRELPRWAVKVGAVVVALTIATGLAFDVGPLAEYYNIGEWTSYDGAVLRPSWVLRGALTVTGTIGLFLVIGGAFMALRRREDS